MTDEERTRTDGQTEWRILGSWIGSLPNKLETILAVFTSDVTRRSEPEIKEGEDVINLFLIQCWRDWKYKKRAEEVN